MSTTANRAGISHAHSLVSAGKVNKGTWDFSAEDGNKLLGPNGDDWTNYAKWFLGVHPDQPDKTKAHYGYPFGKNGEVYRNAVISAKGRAAQQGATEVEAACSSLLDAIDGKKSAQARAYSVLDIKSVNEEQRTFEGIASTPSVDRMDDIVDPAGAMFKLPTPMLWQHGKGSITDPVGWITDAKVTPSGITIRGQVAKPGPDYPQQLRDDLQKAWVMIRDKIVRGLSIGFNPIESEPIKGSFGSKYTKWELLEVSAVAIPANQDASIQTIKSLDTKQRAASGKCADRVVRLVSPGVSGKPKPGVFRLPKTT